MAKRVVTKRLSPSAGIMTDDQLRALVITGLDKVHQALTVTLDTNLVLARALDRLLQIEASKPR